MNIRTTVQGPRRLLREGVSHLALKPSIDEPYIDENEVERRTDVSASTWSKRRTSGHTPPFYKIGKNIRYRWSEVVAWIEANTKQRSTADVCADKRERKVAPKKKAVASSGEGRDAR